ncbi:MAG TPA: SGNH/GDSL hydrolase family protein [Candidatus Saccharibacteria bacterium]|jgi:lysophospholipase L1-like esterase|nr:SGNH/GDSL hydrolase family protein [Candidatus Saccharibacteria bacterium]HMT55695.1 SGNH/GDSL hydrolase family protein [Candidatus Saccharibacteria bacterium]
MNKKIIFSIITVVTIISAFYVYKTQENVADESVTMQKPLYVAMGDSVVAGIGLGAGIPGTCGRTDQAYSNKIAEVKNYELKNIACSGATIERGIIGVQKVGDNIEKSQLKQLKEIPEPELITITIGANDIGWVESVARCITATCGSEAETQTVADSIANVQTNLSKVFGELSSMYSSDAKPKIVVTNYYQVILESEAECPALTGVSDTELAWIKSQIQLFNASIDAVVKDYAFITAVPIDFSGHGQCSQESWVQGLTDKAPFHPTVPGQQAIADAVLEVFEK